MNGIKNFTRLTGDVANVSGLVRLKRLGKIRLGIKKKSTKSGKEYPSETDAFVVPPDVAAIYGENPKELDAMFASNNPEEVYVEKLALYGATSGLKCHGDGKTAERRDDKGTWQPRTCPCEHLKTPENAGGQCGPQAHLMVMLPKVSMWGNWQITTRSLYARAGILSSLKNLQEMVGRIAYIPLKLTRIPQEITHDGKAKTHYIVGFTPDLGLPQIMDLRSKPELMVLPAQYQLEPPIDTNPGDDPVDIETDEDEEDEGGFDAAQLAAMDDAELATVQAALNAKRGTVQGNGPDRPLEGNAPLNPKVTATPTSQDKSPAPHASTPPVQHTLPQGTPATQQTPPDRTAGNSVIPASEWAEIIAYVDRNPDLCTLKADWKRATKVENVIRLNAGGQQHFLNFMREQVGSEFPY